MLATPKKGITIMDMELLLTELYRTNCSGSGCPAYYKTNRGTYVVQGWSLPAGVAAVPAGEGIVEVPADVREAMGRQWATEQGLLP